MIDESQGEGDRDPGGELPEKAVFNFGRLEPVPFGAAVGTVAGGALFLATWILYLQGGAVVGPHLGLLANYFPGYAVSPLGAIVGFLYVAVVGFAAAAAVAVLRNGALRLYLSNVVRRAERREADDLLDRLS